MHRLDALEGAFAPRVVAAAILQCKHCRRDDDLVHELMWANAAGRGEGAAAAVSAAGAVSCTRKKADWFPNQQGHSIMKPAAVKPDAQSHVPHCAHCIYLSNAGPFVRIYYCSQFAPLVIFFLLFLAVVKNTKIPHFVRFNCMQSVMIDIIVMLFTIIRSYFPSELRWTAILTVHFPVY